MTHVAHCAGSEGRGPPLQAEANGAARVSASVALEAVSSLAACDFRVDGAPIRRKLLFTMAVYGS